MVPLRILVSLLSVFVLTTNPLVFHQGFVLAKPVDFCWSWSSRPTEFLFLCLTQKSNNLDQQKNLEDQLNQILAGPVDQSPFNP